MENVEYSKKAFKSLRGLPKRTSGLIVKKISQMVSNPAELQNKITPLKVGGFRLRVGDYRIVYTIEDGIYYIVDVRHGKDVYKK